MNIYYIYICKYIYIYISDFWMTFGGDHDHSAFSAPGPVTNLRGSDLDMGRLGKWGISERYGG